MWIFLYISLLSLGFNTDHNIHLSKSEVNYDSQSQSVQVSIMLFLDDLEAALKKGGAEDLKLGVILKYPASDRTNRLV